MRIYAECGFLTTLTNRLGRPSQQSNADFVAVQLTRRPASLV
jgi:hypothetical protein